MLSQQASLSALTLPSLPGPSAHTLEREVKKRSEQTYAVKHVPLLIVTQGGCALGVTTAENTSEESPRLNTNSRITSNNTRHRLRRV